MSGYIETQSPNMSPLEEYADHIKTNYQDKLLQKIGKSFSSYATYDSRNSFVFVPAPRNLAFTCKTIMKKEKLIIRDNIFYNNHPSKLIPVTQSYMV